MSLFITIAIICILSTLSSNIVKLLRIYKHFTKTNTNLQKELNNVKAELDQLRAQINANSENDYSIKIKTMRAEEKMFALKGKVAQEQLISDFISTAVQYGTKFTLYLILIVIYIRNRSTPIMIFDERFNFKPLEGLLSFPTGIANAISVPIWILSCKVTFQFVATIFKEKSATLAK